MFMNCALPGVSRRGGFSLLEVIVALGVMGVAIGIIVSLFTASLTLATDSRNESVAAAYAQERMIDVQKNAALFDWSGLNAAAVGQLTPVALSEVGKEVRGNGFDLPSTLAASANRAQHEMTFYNKFSWEIFAKKPKANAAYVEVTVVVRWQHAGRPRSFALTSLTARGLPEGAA